VLLDHNRSRVSAVLQKGCVTDLFVVSHG